MPVKTQKNTIKSKVFFSILMSFLLVACGGGEDSAPSPSAQIADAGGRTITGVASKGPLRGATIEILLIEPDGFGSSFFDSAVTDENGRFQVTNVPPNTFLLAISSGGEFFDESDQNGQRRITLTSGQGLRAVIPPDVTTMAITPQTDALYEKTLVDLAALGPIATFDTEFQANRDLAEEAYGFDIVSTLPANPTAAGEGSRAYAQLLGGTALALNQLAIDAGLSAMTFATIQGFVADLSDGSIDDGGIDLDALIARFRNNNSQLYRGVGQSPIDFTKLAAPSNNPPVAVGDAFEISDGIIADLDVLENDSDPDDDDLKIISAQVLGDIGGSVQIAEGGEALVYTVSGSGEDRLTYSISDGRGLTASAEVVLVVNAPPVEPPPVNPPQAVDDNVTVDEDNSIDIDVVSNDITGDNPINEFSVRIESEPENGIADFESEINVLFYQPDLNFNGSDSFTYTVSDTQGNRSNVATVFIDVRPINDAPVAVADTIFVDEDTLLDLSAPGVLGNDVDVEGDALSVFPEFTTTPANSGTFELNTDGQLLYQGLENFNGEDSFTYVATDGQLSSAPAQVTIVVRPVNDAPTANPDFVTTLEDNAVEIFVLGNDSDGDSPSGVSQAFDFSSIEIFRAPEFGNVFINSETGTVTYDPDNNFNGDDDFEYSVADSEGLRSNTALVVITVDPVNDSPSISTDPTFRAAQGAVTTITTSDLNGFDAEDGSNDLVFTVTSLPERGRILLDLNATDSFTVQDVRDDLVSYQHFGGNNTFDSLQLTLTDLDGATDVESFPIDISPDDDFARNFHDVSLDIELTGNLDTQQPFGLFEFESSFGSFSQDYRNGGSQVEFLEAASDRESETRIGTADNSNYQHEFSSSIDSGDSNGDIASVDDAGLINLLIPFEEGFFGDPLRGELADSVTFRQTPLAGGFAYAGAEFFGFEFEFELIDSDDADSVPEVIDAVNGNPRRQLGSFLNVAVLESTAFSIDRLSGNYAGMTFDFDVVDASGAFEFFVNQVEFSLDGAGGGTPTGSAQDSTIGLSRSPNGAGGAVLTLNETSPEDRPTLSFTVGAQGKGDVESSVSGGGSEPDGTHIIGVTPNGGMVIGEESAGNNGIGSSHSMLLMLRKSEGPADLQGKTFLMNQIEAKFTDAGATTLITNQAAQVVFTSATEFSITSISGGNFFDALRGQDNALPNRYVETGNAETITGTYVVGDDGFFTMSFTDGSTTSEIDAFLSDDGETVIGRIAESSSNEQGLGIIVAGLNHGYQAQQRPPTISVDNTSPIQIEGGGQVQLSATFSDPDSSSEELTVRWVSSAGSFSDPNIANPVFTAKNFNGTSFITAIVSDGTFERHDTILVTVEVPIPPQGTTNRQARAQGDIDEYPFFADDVHEEFLAFNPFNILSGNIPDCQQNGGDATRTLNYQDNDQTGTVTAGDTASITFSECLIIESGFPNDPLTGSIDIGVTGSGLPPQILLKGQGTEWKSTLAYQVLEGDNESITFSGGATVLLERNSGEGVDQRAFRITNNADASPGVFTAEGFSDGEVDFTFTLNAGFQFDLLFDLVSGLYSFSSDYSFVDEFDDFRGNPTQVAGNVFISNENPIQGGFSGTDFPFSSFDPIQGRMALNFTAHSATGPHNIIVDFSSPIVGQVETVPSSPPVFIAVDENVDGEIDFAFTTTFQDIGQTEAAFDRLASHGIEFGFELNGAPVSSGSPFGIFSVTVIGNEFEFVDNQDGTGEVFCCIGLDAVSGQFTSDNVNFFPSGGFFEFQSEVDGPFPARVSALGDVGLLFTASTDFNDGDSVADLELPNALTFLPTQTHGLRFASAAFTDLEFDVINFDGEPAINADGQQEVDAEKALIIAADRAINLTNDDLLGRYGYVGITSSFAFFNSTNGEYAVRSELLEVDYDADGFGTTRSFDQQSLIRDPSATTPLTVDSDSGTNLNIVEERLRVFPDGEIEVEFLDGDRNVVGRSDGFASADGEFLTANTVFNDFQDLFVGVRLSGIGADVTGRSYRFNGFQVAFSQNRNTRISQQNATLLTFDSPVSGQATLSGVAGKNLSVISRENDNAEVVINAGLIEGESTDLVGDVTIGAGGFLTIDFGDGDKLEGYQSASGNILVFRNVFNDPDGDEFGRGIAIAVEDNGFDLNNQPPIITAVSPNIRTAVNNGGALPLSVQTETDTDGPTPLTFEWSASAGVFDDASSATPVWTAPVNGTGASLITVTVSDGVDADFASLTVDIGQNTPAPQQVQQDRAIDDVRDFFLEPLGFRRKLVAFNPAVIVQSSSQLPTCTTGTATLDSAGHDGDNQISAGEVFRFVFNDCVLDGTKPGYEVGTLNGALTFQITAQSVPQANQEIIEYTMFSSPADAAGAYRVQDGNELQTFVFNADILFDHNSNISRHTFAVTAADEGDFFVTLSEDGSETGQILITLNATDYIEDFINARFSYSPDYTFLQGENGDRVASVKVALASAAQPLQGPVEDFDFEGVPGDVDTNTFEMRLEAHRRGAHAISVESNASLVTIKVDENDDSVFDFSFDSNWNDILSGGTQ